jgi:hypothetical protein
MQSSCRAICRHVYACHRPHREMFVTDRIAETVDGVVGEGLIDPIMGICM